MWADGPVFLQHVTTLMKPLTNISAGRAAFRNSGVRVATCLYRGDAVGDVVLAGDAQQLVLWELEATEGTRSGFLLQLGRVGMTGEWETWKI